MILHTQVLIYDEKKEELTGENTDKWVDCAIHLNEVAAIRKSIDEDRNEFAVIHFKHGDYFIVNDLYDVVVEAWAAATLPIQINKS